MSRDAAVAAIQSLVLSDLRRYFDYPSVARRYGWQGTVWLAFTVEANGAVDRIHVANSSGYDVLDRSAVVAMRRVGRLPETSGWLGGRALEMRVPIIYRLIDQ
jgi:periplasmic protein TonB